MTTKSLMKSETLFETSLLAGIYLDGFQSLITPIVPLFVVAFFIFRLLSKFKSGLNLSKSLTSELTLILIFLLYITFSSHFSCCSTDNLRRIFRFSTSSIIFYVYATSKKTAFKLNKYLTTFSWLNIVIFLISLLGLINPGVWLSLWRIILEQRSAIIQFAEISRGRVSVISPIHMTFLIPLAYFFSKSRHNRLLGVMSFLSGILTILFLGYRSYAISATLGLLILFVLIKKNIKSGLGSMPKINVLKTATLTIVFGMTIYTLSAKIFFGVTLVDRFANRYAIDRNSLITRWNLLLESFELFRNSPLIGIGPGNYRHYTIPKSIFLTNPQGIGINKVLYTYSPEPHNIFLEFLSETGVIGVIILGLILVKFAKTDMRLLKIFSKKGCDFGNLSKIAVVIVSSWMFIIAGMLDTHSRTSLNLFFAFRGIISSIAPRRKRKVLPG